jgi:hypothetical protein
MFERHLSNSSVGLKWQDLTERSRQGYIDDARVALAAATSLGGRRGQCLDP